MHHQNNVPSVIQQWLIYRENGKLLSVDVYENFSSVNTLQVCQDVYPYTHLWLGCEANSTVIHMYYLRDNASFAMSCICATIANTSDLN